MTTNPTKAEVMRNAPARTLFEYPGASAILRQRVHDAWMDGVVIACLYRSLKIAIGVAICGAMPAYLPLQHVFIGRESIERAQQLLHLHVRRGVEEPASQGSDGLQFAFGHQ